MRKGWEWEDFVMSPAAYYDRHGNLYYLTHARGYWAAVIRLSGTGCVMDIRTPELYINPRQVDAEKALAGFARKRGLEKLRIDANEAPAKKRKAPKQ